MFFILTFIALLILPGFFLVSLVAPQLPWFQRFPAGFSLSVALLGFPAVLLLNLHAPLSLLSWLTLAINLILGALYLKKTLPTRQSTNQQAVSFTAINQSTNFPSITHPIHNSKFIIHNSLFSTQLPNYPISPLLIVALFTVCFTLYLFIKTAAIHDFGDHWFYLHFLRHYLDFPLDPSLNPLAGQSISPGTLERSATNGWWVLEALLVQVSGRPLLEAYWFYLPPLLMIVSFLAFYALAWELFENRQAALTAVLLQLLLYLTTIGSHDWVGQGFFTRIAEDKYLVWLVLLPVSLFLLLRYTKSNQGRFLVLLGGSAAALAVTHPFGLLQWAFAAACFALVYLPFNWRKISVVKSAVLLAPVLLFLTVPIVQQLFSGAAALTQFVPAQLQTPPNDTHLIVLSAENNRYLLHPHLIFHPLTLIGVLLAPLLLIKIRDSLTAQFLFATTILPLALLYNPVTAPLLGRFLSVLLLWRLLWILPTALVSAYFLNRLANKVGAGLVPAQAGDHEGRSYRLRFGRSLLIPFVFLGLCLALSAYIADGIDLRQDYKRRVVTDSQQELLTYLCENDDLAAVLVADPALNTLLPACAPEVRLLTYRIFQAEPDTAEEIERFYQSRLVSQATIEFLNDWQARYIVVPANRPLAAQLAFLPDIFIERYTNDDYSLYEFSYLDHPVIQGNEAFIRGELSEADAFYVEALERDLSPALAHYGLGQTRLAQGDSAAEAAFLEAVAVEPAFPTAYLSLAALYRQDGRPTEAETLLIQALNANPNSAILHETLGDLYLERGNETAAIEHYQLAVTPSPDPMDHLLALGQLYNEKGLTEQAVSTYETLINQGSGLFQSGLFQSGLFRLTGGPGFWRVWSHNLTFDRRPERLQAAYLALGQIYEQQGNLETAEITYRQLIRLLPAGEIGYRTLATLLNESGRPQEAIALYEEASRLNFHRTWPYLRLAERHLAQFEANSYESGNLTRAIAALQTAEQIEPGNMEGQQLLARFYQLRSQPHRAAAVYQEAADRYNWTAWPLVGLGQYYLDSGDFEAAELALTTAIARQPAEQTAYNLLAEAYINRQQADEAVALYRTAVLENDDRAWPYLGLGNAYLAAGENEPALAALRDGLAHEPDSAAVYATLGNIYRWNAGDPETAVHYYRQSIALDPANADAHIALASTLIALGREEEALPYLDHALTSSPRSSVIYQTAGDMMWQIGRLEEAQQYYQQALERDGRNAFAHLGLSRIYRQQETYETALEHAQSAVRFSQSPHASGPAHMEQGQIYLALGRPQDALPHLLAAVEALPSDPWFRATLGDYYHYQQNDPAQAVPYYQEAADLAPQQAILQAALGTALYDAGQVEVAVPVMEQAVSLAPHDAAVFLRIGSVLNKYGDWERLVQFYETAVANNIQNADIFTQLGNAYTTLGQEDKALVQYEKAAALEAREQ
jgi:tetratricopeptide (TPR) repeat protein